MTARPRRFKLGVAAGGLLALAACSMGKSCSCIQPIPYGFDESQRHDNFVQARVSASGISFLEADFYSILTSVLPSGSTFTVPPSGCGGSCSTSAPCLCCGARAPDCVVDFSFNTLSLIPEDPTTTPSDAQSHTLHLDLNTDLQTDPSGNGILVTISVPLFGNQSCNVTVNTFSGSGPLDITADMLFNTTSYDMTRMDVKNFMVNNFQTNDFTINGSSLVCGIANFFRGFFTNTIVTQVQNQAASAIQGQLCETCPSGSIADCSGVPGVSCKSNQCIDSRGQCVQRLGVEGTIDAGSLLSAVTPGLSAPVQLYDVAGGMPATNAGGITMPLTGGAIAPVHNPCVPKVPPPTFSPDPPALSGYFDGSNGDVDAESPPIPFDVGLGVHVDQLTQIGYAAYDSGALCLDIGKAITSQLNSSTFELIVPSINDLTHGDTVPLELEMRPQQPPTFVLGAGTFNVDPTTGMKTINMPLVTINLPQLQMDFYAFIDQRYVRIFTAQVDASLPLAVDTSTGMLTPILGNLKSAFKNPVITNSYLLAESQSDIASKFPTILAVAAPFLANALKGFTLPTLLGLKLQVNQITSVDPDPSGNPQVLAIFSDLSIGGPLHPVRTSAQLARVEMPAAATFAAMNTADATGPTAYIDVDAAADGTSGPFEYRYRVDGGFWSPFSEVRQLVVHDPLLFLAGHHKVDVQARLVGKPDSTDSDMASVDVLVDAVPPKVWVAREDWNAQAAFAPDSNGVVHAVRPPSPEYNDRVVQLVAQDDVSPADTIQYSVSLDNGPFTDWSTNDRVALPGAFGDHQLVVRARDEAQNVATVTIHGAQFATGGCDFGGETGSGGPAGVALLAGLLALAGLWLRRRHASRRAR